MKAMFHALVLTTPFLAPAAIAGSGSTLTDRNRAIMTDFADRFYTRRDVAGAFQRYVVADYIQHNPGLADGRDAAVAALAPKFATPGARFDVKRIIVDGDMAVIHLHGRTNPDTPGGAVADIYRLKDGKIVEHWDVIQPMPTTARNPHPMF
ncbi:nuclear transport factor 2 family protein [Sphingomonas sp. SORGH_AS_0879]|uniref:nuclear transport factor 2 family protein n=1 Tax=Sphingomonas sp. SORGH_AS_0879 TaxID=3041790 RepID=UPI00277F0E0C|nr:nuclear transport factor 2 family protein [Sphingomonas sp. SORGH_AS_0879]MDQ1231788.1 putative SnoaL-like aldol condensation-catalyzing enzyme [Sphingomonas sp. SORGH_AS_0879]